MKIEIHQEAIFDILDAKDWYNSKKNGLGDTFSFQVQSQINSLSTNYEKYQIRYSNIRCMIINKFPFLVHYSVNLEDNKVEIFAVFHTSRNPKIWTGRK